MSLISQNPKNHRDALVALFLVPKLGIQRIRLLLQAVDHPAEIFTLTEQELQKIESIGPMLAASILEFDEWNEVTRIFEDANRLNARIITYVDDAYPPLLREIYDPPILLWVKGNAGVLKTPGIAVVGTRRATQYGKDVARDLSMGLANQGFPITSGLAFGVDTAAHKATLEAGGETIAVLGSGIDTIYPQKNAGLAQKIIEDDGAVITEFPMGTPPDAGNFPVRNRIVSGLSLGTLVVESGLKGGSMITAQSALTQNREVFVVPHALNNVNGIGCNHLIKRGAGKLVQSVDDIIEELPHYEMPAITKSTPKASESHKWERLDLDEKAVTICKLLQKEPLHIDAISEELNIPSHQLLSKLLELEMQQCVRQKAGKNFELV